MLGRAGGEGELFNGQIAKKFFLPHLAHFGNGLRLLAKISTEGVALRPKTWRYGERCLMPYSSLVEPQIDVFKISSG